VLNPRWIGEAADNNASQVLVGCHLEKSTANRVDVADRALDCMTAINWSLPAGSRKAAIHVLDRATGAHKQKRLLHFTEAHSDRLSDNGEIASDVRGRVVEKRALVSDDRCSAPQSIRRLGLMIFEGGRT
jgi:hypothetical protein